MKINRAVFTDANGEQQDVTHHSLNKAMDMAIENESYGEAKVFNSDGVCVATFPDPEEAVA